MNKRRKKNREWKLVCSMAMAAVGAGIISLSLAVRVLAAPGDVQRQAAGVRCGQEIAARAAGGVIEAAAAARQAAAMEQQRRTEPLIALDPGHGGSDEGCAFDGVREKDINLQVALFVRKELEEMGYQVLMTRADDSYLSKEDRVALANAQRADAYISIHQNSSDEEGGSGVETWYDCSREETDSKRLAQLVNSYTVKKSGAAERTMMDGSALYVTRNARMPSCLVETGFLSDENERTLLASAEYQEKLAKGIAEGIDLYFHPKTMYLTFDDGPSLANTLTVLDILKKRNIKATFFLVGENVRKHPEIAKRIAEEGHTIGIHCDSHDYREIYRSTESYLEDFERAHQTVLEVTGVDAKLFRFPGGSVNSYNEAVRDEIAGKMEAMGYVYFDWNASLQDAVRNPDAKTLIANAMGSLLGRRKVVLLAHDVVEETGECLEELLDMLPEYEMNPLDESVEPIQF